VRRLIINADDFGLTSGVNRGILEAHQKGVVSSATLMASGRAFDEAVQFAKREPRLGVGCHVVLVDGVPLLPASQVSSLIGNTSAEAQFHSKVSTFALRAWSKRFDPEQIEAEARAQFCKLQSVGIAVTHFDTHKHTHLFPAVLQPLLRAAQACGIRALRNPFAPARPLPANVLLSRPGLWKRYAQVKALGVFSDGFRRTVNAAGLVTTDGTLGIVVTGSHDERIFQAIIENLPGGTWELVCHPGYNDAELQSAGTRLLESRLTELEILTSERAREVLERKQVELITFRELAEKDGG
jgi:hopanoid biosynthesis associated protein HpnK